MSEPVDGGPVDGGPVDGGTVWRDDDPPRGAGRRGPGPVVLLLPLLTLSLALLWVRWHARRPGERPAPPPSAPTVVPGWVGEADLGGRRLTAQLSPLYEEPARVAFEREALEARLHLPEGRPWRLFVALAAGDGSAATPVEWSLHGLVVRHAGGTIAPVVAEAPEPAPDAVADPLQSLLAPPAEGLRPGREVTLVLWGPAPEPGATLTLEHDPQVVGEPAVALAPQSLAAATVTRTLARLDREGAR